MLKFARAMRVTTKMQKEIYQSEINRLFSQLYEYLRKEEEEPEPISKYPDLKEEKGIKEDEEEEGLREEYLCEERIETLIKKEEREEGKKKKEKMREELERLRKLRKKFGKEFKN